MKLVLGGEDGAGGVMIFRATRLLLCGFSSFIRDRRGNIGVMTALLIVPLVGAVGMATEASGWFLVNRAEQSAADSAALAAATNNDAQNCGICTGYISEAKAVASNYGFADGSNNTTVNVTYENVASVPQCTTLKCYVVTVTHNMPLSLTGFVGYSGNIAFGSGRGESIAATAVAMRNYSLIDYCDLSLGGSGAGKNGDVITLKGDPKSQACTMRAEGNAVCDGANTGVFKIVYDSAYSASRCLNADPSDRPVSDPYASNYGNKSGVIPADTCKSYSSETKKGASSLPNPNLISQLSGIPAGAICGDAALTGDVTVSGANNILVIDNGVLDLNGHTLTTAVGAGLTIVFTGNDLKGSYSHYPVDNGKGGVLDIAAPTSGTWSGVAIWQDSLLPAGSDVDLSYSGSSPTFDLTGLVYLPKANVSVSGAINKSSNGLNCFVFVDASLSINGTGSIYSDESQCTQAGLRPPLGIAAFSAVLVY
jgi:Flp pilus assembly protein TadG